jgi:Spy/CpxP family protein refolding chaperone
MIRTASVNQMHAVGSATSRSPLAAAVAALGGAVLTATLLMAATASTAQAQPGAEGRSAMSAKKMERMSSELGLTEAQRYQIEELHRVSRETNAADHARLRELRGALRKSTDDGERAAISDEIGQLTGRLSFERASTMAAVRNVLTEEQRAIMEAKREDWLEQRKEGRGPGKPDWERGGKPRHEGPGRGARERMQPGRDAE